MGINVFCFAGKEELEVPQIILKRTVSSVIPVTVRFFLF